MIVAETERLLLRHFTWDDLGDLAAIYADPIVMKFYPSTRTLEETKRSIEWILNCYEKYGFGLWALLRKAESKFIGRCGLIPQVVDGQPDVEIGYMLAKEYWGQGLATEAACAIRDYGFNQLNYDRLISLIDAENIASQKVAMKAGMTYEKDAIMQFSPTWEARVRVYSLQKPKIEVSESAIAHLNRLS